MNRLRSYRLAGIFLLAAILRCVSISTRGIQYDDAFSIFLAQRSFAQIIQGTAADTMPPLYYFLLHAWLWVSHDLWWLRLLSILLSLGIIGFLYLLVCQLFDEPSALWAAFFCAISPLQYYHAQDIRMYALLAFTQLGYTWFFTRIWKNTGRRQVWNWVGLIGFGTAAMYSHNLAIFFLIVPNIFLVFKRNWHVFGKLLAAQAVIGLAALPWLLLVPGQVAKIQRAFWTPAPGLIEIIQAMMISVTGLPLSGIWFGIGLVLSLVLFIFLVWEFLRYKDSKDERLFILSLAFIPPILLFIASYFIRPVFVPRGFLAATLAYLGLAGIIVARIWSKPGGAIIAICLILSAGIGIPTQASFQDFPRSPFAQAGAFLSAHMVQNEVVLHDNKLSYLPMHYYWPDLPQKFLADEPGSPNDTFALASQAAMDIYPVPDLANAIGSSNRIFFVVFQETIAEYYAAGQSHPQLASLQAAFHQVALNQFNDLNVYEFER
jgi:mannosyltransferase